MYQTFIVADNTIHTYNLFLLLSLISAALLIEKQIETRSLSSKEALRIRICIPILALGGLFGASFFESIFQNKSFLSLDSFKEGLTFYGGFIIGFILIFACSLFTKKTAFYLLHFFTPAIVIAHAIGRIGCFFAGCCFGCSTNSVLGVSYPPDSLPYSFFESTPLHPTQLYESILLFGIFILITKTPFTYRFYVYGSIYSIGRFFLEFLRADARGSIGNFTNLSPSQIISVCLAATCIALLFIQKKYSKNYGS